MVFKKRSIAAMFMVLGFGVVCQPQQGMAQDAAENVVANLSVDAIKAIQRQPDEALRVLMSYAFRCSNDGVVTKENEMVAKQIDNAARRIQLASPLLKMDMDADGDVSRAEFESYARTQAPNARARSEVSWANVDTNEDGVMAIAEIMASAQMQLVNAKTRRGGLWSIPDEIMLMDVDGDGQVTIDELKAVVGVLSN